MSEEKRQPMSFFIGCPKLFLEEQSANQRFLTFIDYFDNEDDRYYAANVFDEKCTLVIKKACIEDFEFFLFGIYNPKYPVYNLFVKDDPEFFIDTLAPLEHLIDLCKYFGMDYELDET